MNQVTFRNAKEEGSEFAFTVKESAFREYIKERVGMG